MGLGGTKCSVVCAHAPTFRLACICAQVSEAGCDWVLWLCLPFHAQWYCNSSLCGMLCCAVVASVANLFKSVTLLALPLVPALLIGLSNASCITCLEQQLAS